MSDESTDPETPQAPEVAERPEAHPAPAAHPPLPPLPFPPPPTVAYVPPDQAAVSFKPGPRPRPLLGPIYWTFGVVLWSYVVLGQYTTDAAPWSSRDVPLGGGAAAWLFVSCGALALWRSIAASARFPSRFSSAARAALTFLVTILFWWATLMIACLLAAITDAGDVALKLFLFLVALAALFFGRRWSRPHGLEQPREHRALLITLWVGAVLASLPALFHS